MRTDFRQLNGHNSRYFERRPEKLVLEGFRYWTNGYETGSVTPWELAWKLYSIELGATLGRQLLAELSHFVRVARQCANCPLRTFPYGAHHLCRDECIALGLVAGFQHDEKEAVEACLEALTCGLRSGEVGEAAGEFAGSLADAGQKLLPIPAPVLEDVLTRGRRGTLH